MIVKVSTKFGTVIAKELQTVQLIADEEDIHNSSVTAADQEETEAASDSC